MRVIVATLTSCVLLINATAQDTRYVVKPEYTLRSPNGTFRLEQRAWVSEDNEWHWQTWICPATKGTAAYPLRLWHGGELCWAGRFQISPDEKFIIHMQKTGSGDNYAEIFAPGRDGRFHSIHKPEPSPSLSDEAWKHFTEITGIPNAFYHAGTDFRGWEPDGESVAISLDGTDVNERFFIRDWRLHYNLRSRKFFVTTDERTHNRSAIIAKTRSRD